MFRVTWFLFLFSPWSNGQAPAKVNSGRNDELKFVVYLSRHGVRAPTGKATAYDTFSLAPWPHWQVPAAYLTPHGYRLMELFGAYDRLQLSREGLFQKRGCEGNDRVSIYADSDQRTRETGKALADGLFPGCTPAVRSLAEGTGDPLFHRTAAQLNAASGYAVNAVSGRIGKGPDALTQANRAQITDLDNILSKCGTADSRNASRTSLFSIPATLAAGDGDHLVDLKGPLYTASTITENLLLAYTDGKPSSEVGWGCVDGERLRTLIALHTAATDVTQRTPAIAGAQGSNLLDHIRRSIEQAVTQRPVPGARSKPNDTVLFLVGHDTNILNLSALLRLSWIADGRRDDTAPGGALVFELWQNRKSKAFDVRLFYTVQTLEQMRESTTLTLAEPPQRVRLYMPDCSRTEVDCSWPEFNAAVKRAADSRFVDPN